MKTTLTLLFSLFIVIQAEAQFWKKVKDAVKRGVENTVEKRAEKETEKATDKTLDKIFKKGDKSDKKKKKQNQHSKNDSINREQSKNDAPMQEKTPFSAYQKFSFIQGEKIIASDDFMQDDIGDLPANWISSGSAEVVTLNNFQGNWVRFGTNKNSTFIPEYINQFPDNFTLEFDYIPDFEPSKYAYKRDLYIYFSDLKNPEAKMDFNFDGVPQYTTLGNNDFSFTLDIRSVDGGPFVWGLKGVSGNSDLMIRKNEKVEELFKKGEAVHVSIWRQGRRMRIYLNERKVIDISNAFAKNVNLNTFRFGVYMSEENEAFYMSNIRYAVGKPDTRNKLIKEGKFTTSAILFDVNSADIKPESYGILKQIASALKAVPSKKVLIIGHTDSDGDDAANQILSEKRADAVSKLLKEEFAVSNEIQTEGKGESESIADNETASGKAQNRRVEFILN